MRDLIGRTLGHYRIVDKIGEGGMGEVYRARDDRLDRDVAIKVLPEAVSEDPQRLARFEREAKLLGSLSHQNIATLYGLEEHDGQRFLAMELAEGETVAERIKKGPIPVDDALDYACQIAEGLEAAHEQGIIHRDLKPANMMVDSEGRVRVLDFGLAKAFDPEASGPMSPESLAESPTLTADMTRAGVLLGTAPYMSPEQAHGKAVDKKTDVWAFGCVLYEMLTGTCPFAGATSTEVLASIIKEEPNWDGIPAGTPAPVGRLLRRCLTKDPRDRLHDIADARIELQSLSMNDYYEDEMAAPAPARTGWRNWLPWGVIVVLAALAVAILVGSLRAPAPRAVTKTLVGLEPAEWLGSVWASDLVDQNDERSRLSRTAMALSPDGRYLAFSGGDDLGSRLYVRAMDEIRATSIRGTDGGVGPFFSPDGEWIGFWADGQLKKVRTNGGPVVPVCNYPYPPFGASWGPENAIVFGEWSGGVLRVSANGGAPEEITELAEGESFHRHPRFLPDGETLIFTVRMREGGLYENTRIVAQSLKSGDRTILVENGADAWFAPTGHLVFSRLGALVAVPFDAKGLGLDGGAVVVLESVRQGVNAGNTAYDTFSAQFSFSPSGTLVHVPGGAWSDRMSSLVWVDRQGRTEPLSASPGPFWGPRLSPEGQRVAFASAPFEASNDLWIHELSRGTVTRLTLAEGGNYWPLWTPDSSRITFMSQRNGSSDMYWIRADGSGVAERLSTHGGGIPNSWSPDGETLAFSRSSESGGWDIWILPREGEPQPFIESPFQEVTPTFSPDGRWLAYASDQTGRFEVYVTPFPGPGPRVQISAVGGLGPTWAQNGRELFYGLSGKHGYRSMWAVDVTTEPRFSAGTPKELFTGDYHLGYPPTGYDVTPDGKLFLMAENSPRPEKPATHIHVTLNWVEELRRLAPTD